MNALLLALAAALPIVAQDANTTGVPIPPLPSFTKSDPVAYGTELARHADLYDRGWIDDVAQGRMTLFDSGGDSVERSFVRTVLEKPVEGDKSVIRFLSPAEIKGVAALTHEQPGSSDDNWLYLPANKRVRRISGANKTASFQGTEFTYEDLANLEVVEYDWRFIDESDLVRGEEAVPVYRVEARPNYAETGYSRIVVSFHRETWRRERIEFYDKAGEHLKTLDYADWKLFHCRFWRAMRLEMKNHQTGKRTVLETTREFLNLSLYTSSRTGEPRENLTDAQFTTQALEL